nr:hypothetical protein [Tanacetum cinerariifolium]
HSGLLRAEAEEALDGRPQATQGNNAELPKFENKGEEANLGQHFARHQAPDGVGRYLINAGAVVGVLLAFGKAHVGEQAGDAGLDFGELLGRGYGIEYQHALAAQQAHVVVEGRVGAAAKAQNFGPVQGVLVFVVVGVGAPAHE